MAARKRPNNPGPRKPPGQLTRPTVRPVQNGNPKNPNGRPRPNNPKRPNQTGQRPNRKKKHSGRHGGSGNPYENQTPPAENGWPNGGVDPNNVDYFPDREGPNQDGNNGQPPVVTPTPAPPPNVDAIAAVRATFEAYGMLSLFDRALALIQDGFTDPQTILYSLKDTPEYRARFKANEARVRAGLSELSPGTYVMLENQYRDFMATAGLPSGFYDSTDDFTGWIAGDVSPMEAQSRVATARTAAQNVDPNYRATLRDFYGIDDDSLTAYFLDPDKTTAMLENQQAAATVAGAGRNAAFNLSRQRAEQIASMGVGLQQAQQVFDMQGTDRAATQRLAGLYNEKVSEDDLVVEGFNLDGGQAVTAKRKKLASQERAAFSGSGGVGRSSLGRRKRGGL